MMAGGYVLAMTAVLPFPVCPFQRFLSQDCPTCGTTRSVSLIFSCDFSAAFFANPIGFVLIAALLRIGILGSVPKNQLTEALDSRATEIVLLILFFIGGFWHSISKF